MAKKKIKAAPTFASKAESTLDKTTSTLSSNMTISANDDDMLFTKRHFMTILAGIGLMTLGYILMSGGSMPDANTWDESIIYGFRRTVLAPILIVAGLGVEVYAIFRK